MERCLWGLKSNETRRESFRELYSALNRSSPEVWHTERRAGDKDLVARHAVSLSLSLSLSLSVSLQQFEAKRAV